MRARTAFALLAVGFALTYAGPAGSVPVPAPQPTPTGQRYEVDAHVISSARTPPELCVGTMTDSIPPRCGGPRVEPWDWNAVDGEETARDVTWGGPYYLVGTFDGTTFRLTQPLAPPRPRPEPTIPPFDEPPCAAPGGDWLTISRAKATDRDLLAATEYAIGQPDFAGRWVTSPDDGPRDLQTTIVYTYGFTGNLARHERAMRERYGGRLCVVRQARSYRELERIQSTVHAGRYFYSSHIEDAENIVEVGVLVADDATRRLVEDRVGPGVVRLNGILRPVP